MVLRNSATPPDNIPFVTDATEPAAALTEVPAPVRASRVWRMVLFVVSAQLVIIALGMTFFTLSGLANDGTGGCGGG